MRKIAIFLGIFFIAAPLFCSEKISDYAEQKILQILNPYVVFGLKATEESPLQRLMAWEAEVEHDLPSAAIDLEQERLIFESLFLMEKRHYQYDPKSPEMYKKLKEQFKKNDQWISEHEKEGINRWLYLFTGDMTSCYMMRSIPATLYYGLGVKRLYENAIKVDPSFAYGHINLGIWKYYAPGIFGGGAKKALKHYEAAAKGAKTDKAKYIANLYLSQYWFEKKDMEKCAEFLDKAEERSPGNKELALIRKVNTRGISLFEFNRSESGIDENTDEEEE